MSIQGKVVHPLHCSINRPSSQHMGTHLLGIKLYGLRIEKYNKRTKHSNSRHLQCDSTQSGCLGSDNGVLFSNFCSNFPALWCSEPSKTAHAHTAQEGAVTCLQMAGPCSLDQSPGLLANDLSTPSSDASLSILGRPGERGPLISSLDTD